MRKIGSVPVLALCMLNTWEPDIDARLTPARDAIELHKQDTSTRCVIPLDCKVQGEPTRIDFELATLKGPKSPPLYHQVRRVTFTFADGAVQSCATEGAKAKQDMK
jgi:hypothetical protein